MSEGVLSATTEQFEAHPYVWGGVLLGVVAVVYLYSKSGKTTAAAQSFNFSYGPSDAQVVAGTQLQIAQVNANAQASMAASNNSAATTVAGDYYSYLTNASANTLSASQDQTAAAVAINGQNVGGATYVAGLNQQAQLNQQNLDYNQNIYAGQSAERIAAANISANYNENIFSTASAERVAAANINSKNAAIATAQNLQWQQYAAGVTDATRTAVVNSWAQSNAAWFN